MGFITLPHQKCARTTKIGLPIKTDTIRQTLDLEFVKDVSEIRLTNFEAEDYVIIGGIPNIDIYTAIRLNDGSVHNLYDSNTLRLGSSIRNYVIFLQLLLTVRPFHWEGKESDKEIEKRLKSLIQTFKEIDPETEFDPDQESENDSFWLWYFTDALEAVDSGEDIE